MSLLLQLSVRRKELNSYAHSSIVNIYTYVLHCLVIDNCYQHNQLIYIGVNIWEKGRKTKNYITCLMCKIQVNYPQLQCNKMTLTIISKELISQFIAKLSSISSINIESIWCKKLTERRIYESPE